MDDCTDLIKMLFTKKALWNGVKKLLRSEKFSKYKFEKIQLLIIEKMVYLCRIGKFTHKADAQTASFLREMGFNICRDLLRKGEILVILTDYPPDASYDNNNIGSSIEIKEEAKIQEDCLNKIGSPCREIIKERVKGGTYKEVFQRLEVFLKKYGITNAANLKKRFYRCRKLFIDCYKMSK